MRAIAGLLAFMAIVMIAVIMLVYEWVKKRKNNIK
jgi:Flp pilus assembly pilin Flp